MTSFGISELGNGLASEVESVRRALEPLLPNSAPAYVQRRLLDLADRLLRIVGANGIGERLEQIALMEVDIDTDSIRQALVALRNALEAAGKLDSTDDPFSDAFSVLDGIANHFRVLERMEIGLRLEMVVNRVFQRALGFLPADDRVVLDLTTKVAAKLDLLTPQQRAEVWAKITAEIALDSTSDLLDTRVPLAANIVGRDFFQVSDPRHLAEKTAQYLVDFRPRLVRAATAAGQRAFPFPPLAIAQILGWKNYPSTPTDLERRLARHVAFLAWLATNRLKGTPREVAHALGVAESARLVGDSSTNEPVPDQLPTVFHIFIAECHAVASIASAFTAGVPGIEFELLRRYKLSKEFAPRENRAALQGKNEEFCQRDLASFLIQHGAYAVGTKFGPQETDLVTGTTLDPLIIEAKLFKRGTPHAGTIRKSLVQLREYMDKAPFKSRGALVFFNLTEVPIMAPRELIDGRVAIFSVNLSDGTASKHDKYCQIGAGPAGSIQVHVVPVTA